MVKKSTAEDKKNQGKEAKTLHKLFTFIINLPSKGIKLSCKFATLQLSTTKNIQGSQTNLFIKRV